MRMSDRLETENFSLWIIHEFKKIVQIVNKFCLFWIIIPKLKHDLILRL
jgi:hypothetical protein